MADNHCDVYLSEYTEPDWGRWELIWSNEKRNLMYSKEGAAVSHIEKLFKCLGRE